MLVESTEPSTYEQSPVSVKADSPVFFDSACFTHDLAQLLTAMLCNVSMAKCTLDSNEPAFHKLTVAEIAALRAKDLIQQFSMLASLQASPLKKQVNLGHLLQVSIKLALCGSHIPCYCHFPDDLWPVIVDEGQMNRVFQNLLLNARQASKNGGLIRVQAQNIMVPHVRVNNTPALQDGPYVMISLEDQGRGIAAQALPKIFHRHYTTKPNGSGLGLAIVHSIITQHQGHIAVDSHLERGSTFTIYLPASPSSF